MLTSTDVTYDVLEVESNGEIIRILAPDYLIVEKLIPISKHKIIGGLKKLSTINFFVEVYKEGNKMKLSPIENVNMTIDNFLSDRKAVLIKSIRQYTHFINTYKTLSNERLLNKIPISNEYKSELTTEKEGKALINHFNYYLNSLGLALVDENKYSPKELFSLSTIGDSILTYNIFKRFHVLSNYKEYIFSNQYMQIALINLGFFEFISIDKHLAGTFFETLLAAANLQNNNEVEDLLVNSILEKLPKEALTKRQEYFI